MRGPPVGLGNDFGPRECGCNGAGSLPFGGYIDPVLLEAYTSEITVNGMVETNSTDATR
jgi:hypothetical protein